MLAGAQEEKFVTAIPTCSITIWKLIKLILKHYQHIDSYDASIAEATHIIIDRSNLIRKHE